MQSNRQSIIHLLEVISGIQNRYEEVARVTGENYNIFSILRLDSHENSHSLILSELLNPKGSHGQGSIYLNEFITILKKVVQETEKSDSFKKFETDFICDSAKSVTEFHIGTIDEDTGGRLDILLTDRAGKTLIVENKIYARLQDRQLERYLNHAKGDPVIFLTLTEKDFDEENQSLPKADNLIRISYQNEILQWLESCREKSVSLPVIRETLTQYIHLVQTLTNKSTNQKMSEEIIKVILSSRENFKSYQSMKASELGIYDAVLQRFREIAERLSKESDLELITRNFNYTDRTTIGFTNTELRKRNLMLGFAFDAKYFHNFFWAIGKIQQGDLEPILITKLQEEFAQAFGRYEPSDWWPAGDWFKEPWRHWGTEALEEVLFSEPGEGILEKDLLDKLIKMKEITARC